MSARYYYSIDGEVSLEPVPWKELPTDAEYVVAEERAGEDPVPWFCPSDVVPEVKPAKTRAVTPSVKETIKEDLRSLRDSYGKSKELRRNKAELAAGPMRSCPSCNQQVSKKAKSCPGCGHPIAKQGESGTERVIKWCLVIAIVFGFFIFISSYDSGVSSGGSGTGSGSASQTMDLSVSIFAETSLMLESRRDYSGQRVTLHLNGSPLSRSTYRTEFTWPSDERIAIVELSDFTRRSDGQRFSPYTHRVTELWIGGGGYDHTQYTFR